MPRQYPRREDHEPYCECGHSENQHQLKFEKEKLKGLWNKIWHVPKSIQVNGKCLKCYCPKYTFEEFRKKCLFD